MVIGRRRPRKHAPHIVQNTPNNYNLTNLILLKSLSSSSTTQTIQVLPSNNTIDWNTYTRATPSHVTLLHQFLFTYWNIFFSIVYVLPFRSFWDQGGLQEALEKCPYESFVSPSYVLGSLSIHNRRNKEPKPCVYKLTATPTADATTTPKMYVGYRGIVFDENRMLYDRATSIASLHELMSWNQEICYVDLQNNQKKYLSAKNISSFGFPVGLNRAGRHPRHGQNEIKKDKNNDTNDNTKRSPKIIHISSLISVLQLHNGYYHWVTERLPSLCLILPVLQSNPNTKLLIDLAFHRNHSSNNSSNHNNRNKWCLEYLTLLGIDESRVIQYDPTVVYSCDELYVTSPIPSYSTHRGLFQLIRSTLLIPSIVPSVVPSVVLPLPIPFAKKNLNVTLIERKNSKVRRASIWNVLKQRIETRWPHFTVTVARLSAMSVQQQMQLFHGSDVVVGVHGAGLANVVWCDVARDARVVEIVPINPPQVRHLFWHMSSSLGLKYYPYHVMSSWNDSLMEIDVDGLEKRLVEVVNDE